VAITHSVGTQYADVSLQRGSFSFRVRQNRTTRMSFRLEAR
jgi:hypothetical protein